MWNTRILYAAVVSNKIIIIKRPAQKIAADKNYFQDVLSTMKPSNLVMFRER